MDHCGFFSSVMDCDGKSMGLTGYYHVENSSEKIWENRKRKLLSIWRWMGNDTDRMKGIFRKRLGEEVEGGFMDMYFGFCVV